MLEMILRIVLTSSTKTIVMIVHDDLEWEMSSLSINERKEFVIFTPSKVIVLVLIETPTRTTFVIETALAQGMTRSSRCYTQYELSHGGKKKEQLKRTIAKGKLKNFIARYSRKTIQLLSILRNPGLNFCVGPVNDFTSRLALIKSLDDTYVPMDTSNDNVASMINQVT